jgi:fructose-1,6-bisphosphatase/inositol monophosphatase family enzyme
MSPRLQFAIDAAYRGGKSTLAHFQTGAAVTIKSDSSPVTVADLGAERIIRDEIERSFPGESILGEEHGATGNSASRWIIDPIDGTKSFVAGVPTYATC